MTANDKQSGLSAETVEAMEAVDRKATPEPVAEAGGVPLLPCPFCGESRIFFNRPTKEYKGSINCPACLATVPREVNDDQELINCWNGRDPAATKLRRAQPSQPTGDAGELVERVARAIWKNPAKCDLRNVTEGPCGLADECSCWPTILKVAEAAIEAAGVNTLISRSARMEQIALFLWDRLDDIDTLSDAVKCDDKAYRSGAERINRRRFDVGSTDGYTVTLALSPSEPAGRGG